jgi:hypothetical protein
MIIITSIFTRSVMAVAAVGGLSVLADGAVRSELERAVRGNLSLMGLAPAPVRVALPDDRYVAKGLERTQLGATVLMVGADDAQ